MCNDTPQPSLFDVTFCDPDDARLLQRFRDKFTVQDCGYETPCWVWHGALTSRKYGSFSIGTRAEPKNIGAHRYAYQVFFGEITDSKELDHKCRNHFCVNPEHLELVTHKENILRGESFSAKHAKKTHCPKGHPYSGDNLVYGRNGRDRFCMECRRISNAKRSAKNKKPAKPPKTHCPQGHPYSGDNLAYSADGKERICRACRKAASARQEERRRAARLAKLQPD